MPAVRKHRRFSQVRHASRYVLVLMATLGLFGTGTSFIGRGLGQLLGTALRSETGRNPVSLQAQDVATADAPDTEAAKLFLPGEHFIAMNRFRVREGTEAQFEKRWKAKESSLQSLEGFQWFCLLRRVPGTPAGGALSVVYNYDDDMYEDDYSYVSMSMWDGKKDFEGHAKEATGFVTTALNGFKTPSGPPKSASWDGMLLEKAADAKAPSAGPEDGAGLLAPEIFVVMNRFSVSEGSEAEFEKRWAERQSKLQEAPGFRFFHLMRRDGAPDDDVNYISMSAWDDRESFDAWWGSKSFANMAQVQGNLLDREITRYFYEGKLVLESEKA